MLLKILGYLFQLCLIIGLFYALESQGAFLQYTICVLALLVLVQRLLRNFFWKKEKQLTLCLSCTQNDSPTFYWYS